jgi:glyoxylase-like metal-dependent hydrolase (beta-lactamase superfamily II)
MTINDIDSGAVSVTRVIDLDRFDLPLHVLFPSAGLDEFRSADLLAPDHIDIGAGTIKLAVQSFLIRIGKLTILVDTCVGEHKTRTRRPDWNNRSETQYLANLHAAGCRPEDVDVVLCTHLHADHVGWNTRLDSGRWVPTFANARYVVSGDELDHWTRAMETEPDINHGSFRDSVLPIIEHRKLHRAAPGDHVAEGASLIALPGHTAGQIGLDLDIGGFQAVLCGDAIHSPIQVLFPHWSSAFCFDKMLATATRTYLLQRAVSEDLLLLLAHLRGRGLRVAERGGGFTPLIET